MIHTSELMLGDWVSLDEEEKLYDKVWALSPFGVAVDANSSHSQDFFKENELWPIHITPEILEKNGLKPFEIDRLRDKHSSAKWWAKGGSFFVKQYNFKHNDFKPTYSIGTHPNSLIVGLKYVHELQHALRLCGIDKEIEL